MADHQGETGKQGPTGRQGVPGHTGKQGVQGASGKRGLQGDPGPPVTSVTTADLMRAIKYASGFGVAGLVAVGLALAIFVTTAESERREICEVVVKAAEGNAEALIEATSVLTIDDPESRARYEAVVSDYRARVQENLEGCQ